MLSKATRKTKIFVVSLTLGYKVRAFRVLILLSVNRLDGVMEIHIGPGI